MQNVIVSGADPSGSIPADEAVADAIAKCPANQVALYFPAGKYTFSGGLSINLLSTPQASVVITGDASDATELTWPGINGGIALQMSGPGQSFHIRNMALTTGQQGAGNSALLVQQTANYFTGNSDITGIVVRGSDGYELTNWWKTGLNLQCIASLNISECYISGAETYNGTGIFVGNPQPFTTAICNISNCIINFCSYGLVYGPNFQGMTVMGTNFTANTNGILQQQPNSNNDQLIIIGCQFGNPAVGGSSIVLQDLQDIIISNNLFLCDNKPDVWHIAIIGTAQRFIAHGNSFFSGMPIVNNANIQDGVFVFNRLQQTTGVVTGGTTGWQISMNV